MLQVSECSASVEGTPIVKNLSCSFASGSTTVIMGPNGSGKSTFAQVLMGNPVYEITGGRIMYNRQDVRSLSPDKRSRGGLFLVMQHIPEIPGVSVRTFLRELYRAHTAQDFSESNYEQRLSWVLKTVNARESLLDRNLNEGFSGGEKKRFEVLQALLVSPSVLVLDEVDSGLDVDALHDVLRAIHALRAEQPDMIVIMITHYGRIATQVHPDRVLVMRDGAVAAQGGISLAQQIEKNGYAHVIG